MMVLCAQASLHAASHQSAIPDAIHRAASPDAKNDDKAVAVTRPVNASHTCAYLAEWRNVVSTCCDRFVVLTMKYRSPLASLRWIKPIRGVFGKKTTSGAR